MLAPAADKAAGHGARVLAMLEHRCAGNQCRHIAAGTLHQALAARREVMHDLGCVQPQPLENRSD